MSKKYDVVFANGTYMKDGEEKVRWLNCGAVIQTDKGFSLNLDCIPTRRTEGEGLWFKLFEPKPKQNTPPAAQSASTGDDDIPF